MVQPITIDKHFKKLQKRCCELNSYDYWIALSSVCSSRIEGNSIDFDTYMEASISGINADSKPMREIDDLKQTYAYASVNPLNQANVYEAHRILSKEFVEEQYQGVLRDNEVYIIGNNQLVYSGADPSVLRKEMNGLFEDIAVLIDLEMSITEVFYYASMIHLFTAKIHPFVDGNGRISRLLEKWFLIEKLGADALSIASEKLYQTRVNSYYKNLSIGDRYETCNWDLCVPFLKMLPMALRIR